MFRRYLAQIFYAGVVIALTVGLVPLHAREIEITVLHTNDIHQHIENLGRIAYLAKQYRKQHANTLFLDAGDYFDRGSILATLTQGSSARHYLGLNQA